MAVFLFILKKMIRKTPTRAAMITAKKALVRIVPFPNANPHTANSFISPPPKPPVSKVIRSIGTDTINIPINLSVRLISLVEKIKSNIPIKISRKWALSGTIRSFMSTYESPRVTAKKMLYAKALASKPKIKLISMDCIIKIKNINAP